MVNLAPVQYDEDDKAANKDAARSAAPRWVSWERQRAKLLATCAITCQLLSKIRRGIRDEKHPGLAIAGRIVGTKQQRSHFKAGATPR
jgi:hypothetical protein